MLQNTYVDTQGRAPTHPQTLPGLPVPRHNHGTRVVLTTVEVTSAAPTMGLTLELTNK